MNLQLRLLWLPLMFMLSLLALPMPAPAEEAAAAMIEVEPEAEEAADPLAWAEGKAVRKGSASRMTVALSFDDGPHPSRTPQLLEILREKDVKATFFMLGDRVALHPGAARMVGEAGHEIGNHSYKHPNLAKMSAESIRKELNRAAERIEQATGQRPRLMRPPGGHLDATVREVSNEMGLVIARWSVDPRDWSRDATAESVVEKVMEQIHPGAIICLHDTKSVTIEAMPELIDKLRAEGYTLVTVGELLAEAGRLRELAADEGDVLGGSPAQAADMGEPAIMPLDPSDYK